MITDFCMIQGEHQVTLDSLRETPLSHRDDVVPSRYAEMVLTPGLKGHPCVWQ